MNPLQAFLDHQGFVMLDGGLATEMEKRGAVLDDALWSAKMLIDAPEMIRQVHADFFKAGADVVATSTYQASFDGFGRAGYRHGQAERLMRLSVDLALLARETFWSYHDNRINRLRPLVAASIGPFGACLAHGSEYHGNYGIDRTELIAFHRPRMAVLADTEADLFAFETIPSMLEAEALIELGPRCCGVSVERAWHVVDQCEDKNCPSPTDAFPLVGGADDLVHFTIGCGRI